MSSFGRAAVVLSFASCVVAQSWARVPRLFNPLGIQMRAVADLDRDGSLDLVQFNGTSEQNVWNGITCLKNLGTCAFTPGVHQPFFATGTARTIAIADFDGDQQPDWISVATGGYPSGFGLLFYRGLPGGIFGASVHLPLPNMPSGMVVGDANGDNLPDLALLTKLGGMPTVRWFLGVTAQLPAMQPEFTFPHNFGDEAIVAFDRDGDGDDDLAVLTGTALALFDTQNGTLAPQATLAMSTFATTMHTGDLDGDLDDDLMLAAVTAGTQMTATVTRLINQAGVLSPTSQTIVVHSVGYFHLADLDSDGDADAFQRNAEGLAMWENTGSTFTLRRTQYLGAPRRASEPGFFDMDGDGHLDFVDATAIWYGNGSFASNEITIPGVGGDLRDWDDDGDLDVIGGESMARNDGAGSFTTVSIPFPVSGLLFGRTDVIADFDGNRRNDRLVEGYTVPFPHTPVFQTMVRLEDSGAGQYIDRGPVTTATVPMWPPAFAADVNGDTLLDVVDGNGIWVQQAGVQFAPPVATGSIYRPLAAGDVDGDGDIDFLAGRNGTTLGIAMLVQTAPNTLTEQVIAATTDPTVPTRRPAFADLDEDGDLDVAVDRSWSSGQYEVWANNGGQFSLAWSWTSPGLVSTVTAIAGDLDADGRTDVAFAVGDVLRVFRRTSAGFTYEGPFDFAVPGAGAFVDLDGDGDLDLAANPSYRNPVFELPFAGGHRQYGTAAAGSGGIPPVLGASGLVRSGETHVVRLRDALGGSFTLLGLGFQEALYPSPVIPGLVGYTWPLVLVLGYGVGGAPGAGRGVLDVPVVVPPGFSGLQLYFQHFVFDPGSPNGLAHSNGLECTIGG